MLADQSTTQSQERLSGSAGKRSNTEDLPTGEVRAADREAPPLPVPNTGPAQAG